MMREVVHTYGVEKNLNGIASIPENINKTAAVILFNAGVLHKVNAFNMNIDVMKALTIEGAFVFRFDLSGMGDSSKSSQNKNQNDQVINDLTETMDFIENKYHINEFIFVGLCTGADYAHKISIADERVMGVVWLDGYGYPTSKFSKMNVMRHLKAAMNPEKLLRFINKKISSLQKGDFDHPVNDGVDNYVWELPEKEEYRHQMQNVFKRGCKCLYIYSGGVNDYYLYKNQFHDSFKGEGFLSNIEVEYYKNADHLYVLRKHRSIMLSRLQQWMNNWFSMA